MIQVQSAADLQPAITEIIIALTHYGPPFDDLAASFKQFVSARACWTTSTEYLTEARKVTQRALDAMHDETDAIYLQLEAMLRVIDGAQAG